MSRVSILSDSVSNSNPLSNPNSKIRRSVLQGQASLSALGLAIGFFAAAGPLVMAPTPASAACVTSTNAGATIITCSGADGTIIVNGGNLVLPTDSVKLNLGQGPSASTVTGNVSVTLVNGKDVTIDMLPTSVVNANGGDALKASANGAGNVTINANGAVANANGNGVVGNIADAGSTGNITVTTGSNVTATAGAAIDARHFSSAVGNAGVTVTTAAGKTITTNGGSGITTALQLQGSGGITINNASNIAASGGFGIDAMLRLPIRAQSAVVQVEPARWRMAFGAR
jgi:hypothetical protein